MQKPTLSAAEIKERVAAEVLKSEQCADMDPSSLIVLGHGPEWRVTLRRNGPRLNEAHFAAIAGIGQRLVGDFDLEV